MGGRQRREGERFRRGEDGLGQLVWGEGCGGRVLGSCRHMVDDRACEVGKEGTLWLALRFCPKQTVGGGRGPWMCLSAVSTEHPRVWSQGRREMGVETEPGRGPVQLNKIRNMGRVGFLGW